MSEPHFLDADVLAAIDAETFHRRAPFPSAVLEGALTEDAFRALCRDFPPITLFERHEGVDREYGQRPHDRHYLAYESSIYEGRTAPSERAGIATADDLQPSWRQFMSELENSVDYRRFIERSLGRSDFSTRYAWHIGTAGSEVSPHRDAVNKLGTHIFYFNPEDAWDPAWGGALLALGGRRTDAMNPDFDEFDEVVAVPASGNRSFLFKNTPDAWHGVERLASPEGRGRRLFNVIFETEAAEARPPRRLLSRLRAGGRSEAQRQPSTAM